MRVIKLTTVRFSFAQNFLCLLLPCFVPRTLSKREILPLLSILDKNLTRQCRSQQEDTFRTSARAREKDPSHLRVPPSKRGTDKLLRLSFFLSRVPRTVCHLLYDTNTLARSLPHSLTLRPIFSLAFTKHPLRSFSRRANFVRSPSLYFSMYRLRTAG